MQLKLTILLFCLSYILAMGQGTNHPKLKGNGAIYGIVESEGAALPYASVSLFKSQDGKLVNGLITDEKGKFEFKDLSYDVYDLKISFVGFETLERNGISINESNAIVKINDLQLTTGSKTLKEVEITSNIPLMDYQIDKKVINVDKQITSASGTAADVLQNVPSVNVDVTGEVTLRGSTGFMVFIDGRPSPLSGSEALSQIPASNIDKIEIITNPSAKYDPDGTSGIINIVTKKNLIEGFSGVVNGNIGIDQKYGGDFLLYYRKAKASYFIGANYNHRYFPGVDSSKRITQDTFTTITRAEGNSNRLSDRYSIKGGLEVPLTVRDFLSVSGEVGFRRNEYGSDLIYKEGQIPAFQPTQYRSENLHARSGLFYNINTEFEHKFLQENHNLKVQLNYNLHQTNEHNDNELTQTDGTVSYGQKTTESGPGSELRGKLDYTLPTGTNSKIEAGLQARLGNNNDTNKVHNLNTISDEYEFQPIFSNSINYKRNIYAGYAMYGGELNNFGYQAGLRLEYTDRFIRNLENDSSTSLNRMDYFPSVHISYKLPKDHQLMVSYSRRIERPRSYYFEPFITWVDAFNVRQGNPDLLPEYIDSYELGYSKKVQKTLFSLEGYYRMIHNKIDRIQSVYSENVILSSFSNVGAEHNLGLEGMISLDVYKWWNLDLMGNVYALRGDYNTGNLNNESNNWSTRFNNTFYIGDNTQFQLNSQYNSESVTAQGKSASNYYVNAAIKQSFLQKRLSMTLQANDIFQTSRRKQYSAGEDFYNESFRRRNSPIVMLNISYRFNNFKMKAERSGDGGDGEF